jgi:anti-sigma-K factor RskA
MRRRETGPIVSDLLLERYRLGELPAADRQDIERRLEGDEGLRARLAALEQSDRDIAERYPARVMAAEIRQRASELDAGQRRPAPARLRAWLMPVAAVATCVLVVAVAASLLVRRPAPEDTTIKGGGDPSLVIHRRVGEGSEELKRGATARQGDEIRVGYRASGRGYGAILSIDGRGNLTQHLPRTGDRAATLQRSGTVFLDFAYELDDAPRWEAFYFVTSDRPFDLEVVRRAVRESATRGQAVPAPLGLPRGYAEALFTLTKDQR